MKDKTRKVLLAVFVCVIMIFATACGDDSPPFTHGTMSGDRTYTSEYFGFQLNLQIVWIPISDANLAKTVGIWDMSESNMKKVLDKGDPIYELIAMRGADKTIIITVYDNTKNTAMSEANFFEKGQTVIKGKYIDAGYVCVGEKRSVNFLKNDTDCLYCTASKDGKTTHYITVPVFKGHYTACIEFGAADLNDLGPMIALASAIRIGE